MLNRLFSFIILVTTIQLSAQAQKTKYVDPYIGSSGHGHVFVGANVPFGAVQLGPSNIPEGWDWCSGYHYSSKNILGFSHLHLSGTGIGDLNDILLLPYTGKTYTMPFTKKNYEEGYGSLFDRKNESVRPGYYSVLLDRYQIKAELTASERVGMHQYFYPNDGAGSVLVDLQFGVGWDAPVQTFIKKLNDHTLIGYRLSKGWAEDQRVYFAIEFSQKIKSIDVYDTTSLKSNIQAGGKRIKAAVHFEVQKEKPLQVKVGISPVSESNALANITQEIPHWNFKNVVTLADKKWEAELSKIDIDASEEIKKIYYTGLYHTAFGPVLYNDFNKDYLGTDKRIYRNNKFNNYSIFSLWDTYRTLHPLFTITQPDKINDIIKSFLKIYKQQGKLPVWHLMGNETNTMCGNHAIPVIVDAFFKGYKSYDTLLAYEAIKKSSMQNTLGMQFVKDVQFIPADSMMESVAYALEYAIDDWAVARMAKHFGKKADYEYFTKRSKLYQQYFDKNSHFMRGKLANGKWNEPFNPFHSTHRKDDYMEGNAWQYTWLVPQDVEGLIQLFGSKKAFTNKLDSLFFVQGDMGAEASPDISGLIGQYAHGNEPNHHIPYLFSFVDEPHKTAFWVRNIMDTFYTAKPDGLCGNEDVGQMSAWYVMSALGIYPVNAADGNFVFGSPMVQAATITMPSKKVLHIKAINNSAKNIYVEKIEWDGQVITQNHISFGELNKGGELIFYMTDKKLNYLKR